MPKSGADLFVLAVEDEWITLEGLRWEIEDAGWSVVTANSGESAMALLPILPFDLIVTDIDLAGPIDGWKVAIAARKLNPNVPVIYTTARAMDTLLQVPDGALVKKPYSPRAVVVAGRRLFADPRPHQPAH